MGYKKFYFDLKIRPNHLTNSLRFFAHNPLESVLCSLQLEKSHGPNAHLKLIYLVWLRSIRKWQECKSMEIVVNQWRNLRALPVRSSGDALNNLQWVPSETNQLHLR